MTYFSEREKGELPCDKEEIDDRIWKGIEVLIKGRIDDGSFGKKYPTRCFGGEGITGSDADAVWQAIRAEIPNLWYRSKPPQTLDILNLIEFCWRCIAQPSSKGLHAYFEHDHLDFNIQAGQDTFRDDINRIFRCNGLAYELKEDGCIERLAPPILREQLVSAQFHTGDDDLDRMLETARGKFLNRNEATRREALESLWHAWERLKTLGNGSDKKSQVITLLDDTTGSSSPKFRQALEQEAKELTSIGNSLQIRHSETNQERLASSAHVDYLFHRLFAFIYMILRTNGRL